MLLTPVNLGPYDDLPATTDGMRRHIGSGGIAMSAVYRAIFWTIGTSLRNLSWSGFAGRINRCQQNIGLLIVSLAYCVIAINSL